MGLSVAKQIIRSPAAKIKHKNYYLNFLNIDWRNYELIGWTLKIVSLVEILTSLAFLGSSWSNALVQLSSLDLVDWVLMNFSWYNIEILFHQLASAGGYNSVYCDQYKSRVYFCSWKRTTTLCLWFTIKAIDMNIQMPYMFILFFPQNRPNINLICSLTVCVRPQSLKARPKLGLT